MRKNVKCSYHKNRDMNPETYALRRQVMEILYEAREVIGKENMPRVDIRITDTERHVLGTARMNDCMVWIPAATCGRSKEVLREVVYHELCHALWGVEHDEKCKLMCAYLNKKPLSKAQCQRIFKKYFSQQ